MGPNDPVTVAPVALVVADTPLALARAIPLDAKLAWTDAPPLPAFPQIDAATARAATPRIFCLVVSTNVRFFTPSSL